MADFQDLLRSVAEEAAKLATGELASFKDQVIEDAKQFAQRKKDDLQRWAELLASGAITRAEFDMLVLGAKNLLQIRAETYVGIAKTRLDRLRKQVLDIVIKAAVAALV